MRIVSTRIDLDGGEWIYVTTRPEDDTLTARIYLQSYVRGGSTCLTLTAAEALGVADKLVAAANVITPAVVPPVTPAEDEAWRERGWRESTVHREEPGRYYGD